MTGCAADEEDFNGEGQEPEEEGEEEGGLFKATAMNEVDAGRDR
jgi:hypothetical protein